MVHILLGRAIARAVAKRAIRFAVEELVTEGDLNEAAREVQSRLPPQFDSPGDLPF